MYLRFYSVTPERQWNEEGDCLRVSAQFIYMNNSITKQRGEMGITYIDLAENSTL